MINSVSKAIIETIGTTGFTIDADSITAINQEAGERFIFKSSCPINGPLGLS